MNEQKNLFLAIAISIAIIVFFQLLFPTPISDPIQNAENEVLAPATSIDEPKIGTIHRPIVKQRVRTPYGPQRGPPFGEIRK